MMVQFRNLEGIGELFGAFIYLVGQDMAVGGEIFAGDDMQVFVCETLGQLFGEIIFPEIWRAESSPGSFCVDKKELKSGRKAGRRRRKIVAISNLSFLRNLEFAFDFLYLTLGSFIVFTIL